MVTHNIPARTGASVVLKRGQILRMINTHGHQVVDTWAFVLPTSSSSKPSANDRSAFDLEYMSMCHTRAALNAIRPTVGSTLVSNRRKPMLTLVKDTSPGVHDTFIAACDIYRYQGLIPHLGETSYHENCSDNMHMALERVASTVEGVKEISDHLRGWTPDPFNLFMNIPWKENTAGDISWEAPASKPGDYVDLRAERDVLMTFSACPQDVLTINGGKPVDVHFEIFS